MTEHALSARYLASLATTQAQFRMQYWSTWQYQPSLQHGQDLLEQVRASERAQEEKEVF